MSKRLLFLLLCLGLLVGCDPADSPDPTPAPPLEVIEAPRYTVARGRIEQTLAFAGRTTPTIEEPLLFPVDGTVTDVLVNSGAVTAGEVIARLDVGSLQQQLEEAQLALRSAEINRDEALATAQRDLIDAQLRLQQAQLTSNQAELVAAEMALEEATTDAQRRLADAQLTDAQNRAAVQALVVEQLVADIAALEAEIAALQADDKTTIAIEQAALTIRQLEQAIAERTLVAPFDGVLQTLAVRPGDGVEAFDPVGLVVDVSELDISAELAFDAIAQLSVGQPVTIRFGNRDATFEGQVTHLPAFGSTDSRVRITLADPPANLQPGELANMTVLLAAEDDALLLPAAAVRNFQGRTFVVVEQPDGTRRRADVQLGISDGENVAVTAGVTAGQVVVGE